MDEGARFITLPDGRRLCYSEYGDPSGAPVLYFHGTPGSRFEAIYADDPARRAGLRIIAPDRPGFGGSDYLRNRQFDDWPRDVAALADSLGIGRFALVALSGGGPHALACAAVLGDRITAIAIVSSAGPVEAYIARSRSRVGRWLRRAGLPLVRLGMRFGVRVMAFALRRTSAERMSRYPDPRVLARPDVREAFRNELLEGLRPGVRGAQHEFNLHTRSWRFDLGSVRLPVHFWHGTADRIVKIDVGRYLAARIPNCRARILEGEGHLLIIDHIVEVLAAVSGVPAESPPAAPSPSHTGGTASR
jgi:pimeloyl-ACP methyl ester carboxylesterase